ncbi:DNA-directed primase/polymerase protein-like [Gigantopelta aegis]|uniref:DNA-directed primase/polymerase protein-like n=1 Tax=Gigantopelta aegis TaxID=1735272 RepID=UPI001B888BA7|nr:DNA-directed primase/polymerase protein-like [Gigantopelta aegis]
MFGSASFYGSSYLKRKHEVIAQIVEKRVKKHVEEKLPDQFKPSLAGPSANWETFFRQQEAFEYARTKAKDLCVFAYESKTLGKETGQRRYLVASLPGFWHYYSQLKEPQRHHYEVIPEGAVCKLYFDLEFDKEKNPMKNGNEMVHTLFKYVSFWMKHQFGVTCTRSDVLDLDSSTNKKFSRHLIFQLTDVAFKDNTHAGKFVNYIFNILLDVALDLKNMNRAPLDQLSTENNPKDELCSTKQDTTESENKSNVQTDPRNLKCFSEKEHHTDDTVKSESERSVTEHKRRQERQLVMDSFTQAELESLVVQGKNDTEVLFCDTGVYTKNRNFRLYKSSKLGKNNPLKLSQQNTYELPDRSTINKEKEIFFSSLICNVRYTDKLKILTYELADSSTRLTRRKTERTNENNLTNTTDTIEGYTKSPYPEIDDFILSIITSDGHHGYIRHWSYFTHDELLVYDLARFRFCENIGREHHSNNVMLVVDMKRGVYYQKCHDPVCRSQNFKSSDYKLPDSVLPAHYFDDPVNMLAAEDGFNSDFEDEDCVREADNMERSLVMEDKSLSDIELLSATEDLENSIQEQSK